MTSPQQGFDFSYDPPDFDRMKRLGYDFVLSYLWYRGAPDGKYLTKARVRSIRNAGLRLFLNMEVTAGRMKGGRTLGVADAKDAVKAIADLGLPAKTLVIFSADFDTTAGDDPAIFAYLRGAASVLPDGVKQVGVYGEYRVLQSCRKAGVASYFWQTYAWSYGKVATALDAYQHQNHVKVAGGNVDLDWIYDGRPALFGTVPLPDSSTEEPDVQIVDDTPRLIEVHPSSGVYDPLTGQKVNTTSDQPFQRVVSLRVNGLPNRQSDYYLGRFPDGKSGTQLAAIPIGSADVIATLVVPTAPAPDTTPFDQAYVDKATAALQAQVADLTAQLQNAAAHEEAAVQQAIEATKSAAHIVPATISFE